MNLVVFVGVLEGVLEVNVEPYHRVNILGDASVEYPYLPNSVPTWTLIFICFVFPISVFAIFLFVRRNFHDFHHAVLVLAIAAGMSQVFTSIMKLFSGRLRPNWQVLHQIQGMERESRLSFPSGHASISFATMTVLSL